MNQQPTNAEHHAWMVETIALLKPQLEGRPGWEWAHLGLILLGFLVHSQGDVEASTEQMVRALRDFISQSRDDYELSEALSAATAANPTDSTH